MKKKLLTILLSVFMIITAFTTNVFADVSELNFTITPITKDSLSILPENNIESASPEGKCEAITFSFHLFNVNNEKIAYHDEGGWKKADGNPYEGTPDFSSVDYVIEEIKFGSVEDSFAETMTIKVNGNALTTKLSEDALHTGVEGYFATSNELVIDIKFSVVTKVAKIGDTEYTTFTEAMNSVIDGCTVTLLSDVNDAISLANGKTYTLDLAGHTLGLKPIGYILSGVGANKTVTIKNSTDAKGVITVEGTNLPEYSSSCEYLIGVENETSNLIFDNVDITFNDITKPNGEDDWFIFSLDNGTISLNKTKFTVTNSTQVFYAIEEQKGVVNAVNSEFVFNGISDVCFHCDKVTLDNSKVTSTNSSNASIFAHSSLVAKNGSIVSIDSSYPPFYGGVDCHSENFNVDATSKVTTTNSNEYGINFGIATIEEGAEVTFDEKVTIKKSANIASGDFIGGIAKADGATISLTGGYYKDDVSSFCASGYVCAQTTDAEKLDHYNLGWKVVINAVAQIGNTTYPSLEKAVIAAQDGDTIKLLKDIKLSSPVRLDKEGTFVIDGDEHTIKPTTGASFGADGCLCFGKSGGWDSSEIAQKIFTIKNTTFLGFTTGINDVIRAEGSTLTIDKCTFEDNTISGTARSKSVILLTGVDAKVINSTFTNNTAGLCIDFNTQGGSANPNTPSNIKVDNCYFNGNNLTGNGVMYLYGPKGSITNNTFEENTVTEDGAAVIYLSGKADRIANNLFKGNTIKANGSGKLGVIAFGSSSTGTALEENAFVGNTLNKNGQAPTSGTTYVGADSISVECNYWGDGQTPEIGDEKDIYTTKGTTYNEYATAYTLKKPNSWGVNVTISEKIAKYGTTVYTSYDSAKAAAPSNKFSTGWYFNVNPSVEDLGTNCIVVASEDSNWLFKVITKAVDIDSKTDVEPGQKDAKAPTGETPEAQVAQEAAQIINDIDKTLGGIKDLQLDAVSKLNDSSVINTQLENNAKTALTNDTAIKYDQTKDTMMLVIEPYFDVASTTGKKDSSKITSITYEIDAKYNILATTATTTEQIIKEGIGKNTVIVETNKDLSVTRNIVLSIPLPNEFDAEDGDTVYVKHTHGSQVYYYDATIVIYGGQKFVVFANPNGFSTFEIMLEKPAPTPTPTPGPKPRYIVPNTGIE